ncbi:hypothetical protein GW17_00017625 [Ensete ventricosum]|nr:hypothetical protein GW17_00017625 [Ensete ventricosum]RZR79903.1 hypothetical protein BHM03_00005762 [Ensete ventricosum]
MAVMPPKSVDSIYYNTPTTTALFRPLRALLSLNLSSGRRQVAAPLVGSEGPTRSTNGNRSFHVGGSYETGDRPPTIALPLSTQMTSLPLLRMVITGKKTGAAQRDATRASGLLTRGCRHARETTVGPARFHYRTKERAKCVKLNRRSTAYAAEVRPNAIKNTVEDLMREGGQNVVG